MVRPLRILSIHLPIPVAAGELSSFVSEMGHDCKYDRVDCVSAYYSETDLCELFRLSMKYDSVRIMTELANRASFPIIERDFGTSLLFEWSPVILGRFMHYANNWFRTAMTEVLDLCRSGDYFGDLKDVVDKLRSAACCEG